MSDAGLLARILLVDAETAAHGEFRALVSRAESAASEQREAGELFADPIVPAEALCFDVTTAARGEAAFDLARAANAAGRPFAVAFIAARHRVGWSGAETVAQLWRESPELQVVLCIERADLSWREMVRQLGVSDRLLILHKPFEEIEVLQLAHSLARKWQLARDVRAQVERLTARVAIRTGELERANALLLAEVAERNAALEALRAAEERFGLAFRANPMAMLMEAMRDGRIVEVNDAGLALLARERAAIVERTASDLQLWTDPLRHEEVRLLIRAGEPVRHRDSELRAGDGARRKVRLWGERFAWRGEDHLLLIVEDVTELASLEDQLRQAQKMEAVGALAAGVAHEFNNILTVIQGHLSVQLAEPALPAPTRAAIGTAFAASERAAALTRRLLTCTRQQVIAREPLDLVAVLGDTRALLDRTLGEQIEQRWELGAARPTVVGEVGAIEQIVLNLALNARDAMPAGGTLTLRLETVAGRALLSVSDTGTGIAPENLERIFEPFFTTKPPGTGTGLGLAVVYAIVEKLDGRIDVESTPGRGTTLRVALPLVESSRLQEAPAFPAECDGRGRTVLVAEDEEMLVYLLHGILSSSGFAVLTAPDGPAALQRWEESRGAVDLLITDMVMPGGMSGRELGEQLRGRDPRLPIIYTSGYSPEFAGGDLVLQPGINFLPKPYTAAAVLEIVQRTFAARDRSG